MWNYYICICLYLLVENVFLFGILIFNKLIYVNLIFCIDICILIKLREKLCFVCVKFILLVFGNNKL